MKNNEMKYNEQTIESLYQKNLEHARRLLYSLQVAEGSEREPHISGLNGWVYEQTIRYCLYQELKLRGLFPRMKEQVAISGRKKIDLLVDKVAIEIKSRGIFHKNDAKKYKDYGTEVGKKGWAYFYLAGRERYKNYRLAVEKAFGKDKAFFLDVSGEWSRFVSEIIKHLERGKL